MAVVKNPLLSVDAHGAIGDALIYQNWKSADTARAYFHPSQPRTADQITQRDAVAAATSAWRLYLANFTASPAWRLFARVMHQRMAGYHFAMRYLITEIRDLPEPAFVQDVFSSLGSSIRACMVNAVDGTLSNEPGFFDIYAGPTSGSMVLVASVQIDQGCVFASTLSSPGDVVYSQVFKDGVPRSGIHRTEIVSSLWEWTELAAAPDESWLAVTMSDGDDYVYASSVANGIYLSDDSGASWNIVRASVPGPHSGLTVDTTGQFVAAGQQSGMQARSDDFGATWGTVPGLSPGNYIAVMVPADASRLFWAKYSFRTYRCLPFTANAALTSLLTQSTWRCGDTSGDGQIAIFVQEQARTWFTLDGGTTWAESADFPNIDTVGVKISRDGTRWWLGTTTLGPFLSTDNGASWVARPSGGTNRVPQFAVAGNLPVLLLPQWPGEFYTSNDNGLSWITQTAFTGTLAYCATVNNVGTIAYVGLRTGRIWRGTQT